MQQLEFDEWKAANPHYDDWEVYQAYEHVQARMSTMMYALSLLLPDFIEHDDLLLQVSMDTPSLRPLPWSRL